MKQASAARRAAFTLIELLTVIAIIAILLALSVGVYARVRASAMTTATDALLQKLASVYNSQVRAAIDDSRDSDPDKNNGPARALRLKQELRKEFPQSFAEARSAKAEWATALPATSGLSPFEESAVCLYLALGRKRRGVEPMLDEYAGAGGVKTIGSGNWKVYMDSWGTPIGFYRWPYGNGELASSLYGSNSDPQDPEGLVSESDKTSQGLAPAVAARKTNNVIGVMVSAGPDKNPGYTDQWMSNADTTPAAYDNLASYRVRRAGAKGN